MKTPFGLPETIAHACLSADDPWAYALAHKYELEDDAEFPAVRFRDHSIVSFRASDHKPFSVTISYDRDMDNDRWYAPKLDAVYGSDGSKDTMQ